MESQKEDFNIINNLSLSNCNKHKPKKGYFNADPKLLNVYRIINLKKEILNTQKLKDREFDILSNEYYINHKEKSAAEKEIQKLTAAKNYWRLPKFDILKGQYIDENKEANFVKERNEIAKEWGKNRNKHRHPE